MLKKNIAHSLPMAALCRKVA